MKNANQFLKAITLSVALISLIFTFANCGGSHDSHELFKLGTGASGVRQYSESLEFATTALSVPKTSGLIAVLVANRGRLSPDGDRFGFNSNMLTGMTAIGGAVCNTRVNQDYTNLTNQVAPVVLNNVATNLGPHRISQGVYDNINRKFWELLCLEIPQSDDISNMNAMVSEMISIVGTTGGVQETKNIFISVCTATFLACAMNR